MTVLNSTIANNRSNVPDGQEESVFYDGGGIHSGGAETLQNTIIIGNAIQSESAQPDISDDISGGVIDSYSNVLVGNPGTAGQMVDGTNGSIIGKNNGTQLLPENEVIFGLADTGGPTKTHAFRPASPAIDAGNTAFAVGPDGTTPLATDQRGTGFPRVVGSSVDIGAWEGEPNVAPEILDFAVSGPIDEGGTVTLTGTISDGNAGDVFGGSIDWGDGSPDETIGSLGVGPFQFTHTFADNDADGVYTIEMNINDIGFFASGTTTATVNDLAPEIVSASISPSPAFLPSGEVALNASISDPGGDLISDIEIDWGDGTVVHPVANPAHTSFTFAHTYSAVGEYSVKITFTDDERAEVSQTLNASVTLPPPPAAPTLLRVDSISKDRIVIEWTDNSDNEDGFVIEACRNKGCSLSPNRRGWTERHYIHGRRAYSEHPVQLPCLGL